MQFPAVVTWKCPTAKWAVGLLIHHFGVTYKVIHSEILTFFNLSYYYLENLDAHMPAYSSHPRLLQFRQFAHDELVVDYKEMWCTLMRYHQSYYYMYNNPQKDLQLINKVHPTRIIVEDDDHKLYTWLKYKSYDGPFHLPSNNEESQEMACGNGTAEGTLKGTNNKARSRLMCYMTMGCFFSNAELVSNSGSEFHTYEFTTAKVTNITHCHGHVYVPENATLTEVYISLVNGK